jgi:hypothetical protein
MNQWLVKYKPVLVNTLLLFALLVIAFSEKSEVRSFCIGLAVGISFLNIGTGIKAIRNKMH